jgi:anhydro-N-acetylmuramic acid kinase
MSGTSLDGIDAALIQTDGHQILDIGPGLTIPYGEDFRNQLRKALGKNHKNLELEQQLTRLHGEAVQKLCTKFHATVDLIGFHGQTIYHAPPVTLQWGDGDMLADMLGVPVVYDFRSQDCAHGGQGAPLVPIYHQALCESMPKPIVVLNIGGVANVTYIDEDQLIGFDTGPGNALIDDFMKFHFDQPYDLNGKIASLGKPNIDVLTQWLSDPYFSAPYPKSLDRDHFKTLTEGTRGIDGLATLTAFTAFSIFHSLQAIPGFVQNPPQHIIVSGGGRKNRTVLHWLKFFLRKSHVVTCDELEQELWNGDFMEARAFGFLAVRSLRGLPLSYPLTTGVCEPIIGGRLAGRFRG